MHEKRQHSIDRVLYLLSERPLQHQVGDRFRAKQAAEWRQVWVGSLTRLNGAQCHCHGHVEAPNYAQRCHRHEVGPGFLDGSGAGKSWPEKARISRPRGVQKSWPAVSP